MELEISRITVEVKDRASGRVHRRELAPGAAWPCSVEDLEAMTAKAPKGSSSPRDGDPSPSAPKPSGGEDAPSADAEKGRKGAQKAKSSRTSATKETAKKETPKKETPKKTPKKAPKKKAPKKKTPKKKTSKKKKASEALDLSTIEAREAYDEQILGVVQKGPTSVAAARKVVGGDRMQVVGGLARLVDRGLIVKRGAGLGARYRMPDAAEPEPESAAETPPPKAEVVTPPKERVRLRWRKQELQGRDTLVARFEEGAFRLVPMISGSHGLFYEGDDDSLLSYGCGEVSSLKAVARELAAAGLPDPEVFRANGGSVAACPPPKRMRLGDVELTWRESIKDGRQLCVAPTGEGEMRVMESDGGSFVLVFVRAGDTAFDTLGCGTREDLELRALSLLAEVIDEPTSPREEEVQEAASSESKTEVSGDEADPEPGEPQETSEADEASDQEKEDRLVGSFASVAKQLMESM